MSDLEKGEIMVSTFNQDSKTGFVEEVESTKWQRFKDSFKPADLSNYDTTNMTDLEKAALATSASPLSRSLKSRHLQMIAIGGSIGTGLFVGSGKALHTGGPAALLIGFGIVGLMLYCTVQALGELCVTFPVSGAFTTYATRFIHPSWGFAVGWNYAIQWLVVLPLELVAASITIGYWGSTINPAAWVCIFYVIVAAINLFGVKGYGEAEFVFSTIKVLAVIGFIILGIILNCGGGPEGGYIGGKYWHDPGAFSHGFHGVAAVFVTAAFSFTGTELAGLAAAETDNPRKTLPSAIKSVFWRLLIFYIVSLTIIGVLVPWNDSRLMGATSSADAAASPFVIAIVNAGVKVLPSIMNVVIMIAVLSVGNSAVFGCSRTLAALASQGYAPKILAYVDRNGRPLVGIGITLFVGLLCFISASDKQQVVFDWLMALTGLSLIFTWGSINLCHIRFRRAYKIQNRDTRDIAFKSQVGVYGSWLGLLINALVLVAQFYTALFPIGGEPNASDFFQSYLAAPVVIAFAIGYQIWKRPGLVRSKDIDLNTGRREVDIDLLIQELEEERELLRQKPWYYKAYKAFC